MSILKKLLSLMLAILMIGSIVFSLTGCHLKRTTDDDIVAAALAFRYEYLNGIRNGQNLTKNGYRLIIDGPEVGVQFPKGTSLSDGRTSLSPIIIGVTYPWEFTLGNILNVFHHNECWERNTQGEWVIASSDYSHCARIDSEGNLYIDERLVGGDALASTRTYCARIGDSLCADYRSGNWDGHFVYDLEDNTAEVVDGEFVLNGEHTGVYPAVGTERGIVMVATEAAGNVVAIFTDGRVGVYHRNGEEIATTKIANNAADDTVILKRLAGWSWSKSTTLMCYIETSEGYPNLLVGVDPITGEATTLAIGLTRLQDKHGESIVVCYSDGVIWSLSEAKDSAPVVYGVSSVLNSTDEYIRVRLDTGVIVRVVYDPTADALTTVADSMVTTSDE